MLLFASVTEVLLQGYQQFGKADHSLISFMRHRVFVHPSAVTLIVAFDFVIFDLDNLLLTFQQSLQNVYVDNGLCHNVTNVILCMSLNEVKCVHGFAEFELADGEEPSKLKLHGFTSRDLITSIFPRRTVTHSEHTRGERNAVAPRRCWSVQHCHGGAPPRRLELFR